jgi:hypothetical protein
MSQTKSRFAAAALVAALAVPTVASDAPRCEVCGDEHLAPAIAVSGGTLEAEALAADPTWPAIDRASPAVALTHEADGVRLDGPAEWAPQEQWAIELGAPAATPRVATAR